MRGRKKRNEHYPESFKLQIKKEHEAGASMRRLCKRYGISFYSVESWRGLRPEVNMRRAIPRKRGRSTNNSEDIEKEVKWLEMGNELLRNFLENEAHTKREISPKGSYHQGACGRGKIHNYTDYIVIF